jgi:hypothetical protein
METVSVMETVSIERFRIKKASKSWKKLVACGSHL